MARTLNGNLTGAAAHRSWDDVPSEPLEPEIQKAIETDFYELEIFLRDKAEPGSLDWQAHNRVIEKLRRGESLFSDRADEIVPTEAEAQALERRLAQVSTTEIALNVARYNVEHATPNNVEWAKRRLAEEEAKAVTG